VTDAGGAGPLRYHVWIDDGCIGSGQCELVDGERFVIGVDGLAKVIGEPELMIDGDRATRAEVARQLATLRTAESNCPVGAIHVDEVA
jgi:ferredoxin